MKKEIICLIIAGILALSILPCFSSALGISPAIEEINFVPYEKHTIEFKVHEKNPDRRVTFYAEGDLAQYVTFDKTESIGSTVFKATISLPGNIETPGKHTLYIVAAEAPLEDSFIGTAIRVKSTIKIYVPYPGKYIESSLSVPSANIGESVPVELKVINRGTENLTIIPIISFYDGSMNKVDEIIFSPRQVDTQREAYFRKYLSTAKFLPDKYLAKAFVDYGGLNQETNTTFNVGSLFVNITDFSKNATSGEINKFAVKVKSGWNSMIESVYADVLILNETSRIEFSTPQIELEAWGEREIIGYFDADGLSAGEYDAEVTLNYNHQTSFKNGKFMIIAEPLDKGRIIFIASSVAGLAVLIIAGYIISRFIRKKKKAKSRKRNK